MLERVELETAKSIVVLAAHLVVLSRYPPSSENSPEHSGGVVSGDDCSIQIYGWEIRARMTTPSEHLWISKTPLSRPV